MPAVPRLAVALLLGFALAACDVFGPSDAHFAEDREYRYALFPTPEACEAAQQGGWFNCFMLAEFCRDGRAFLMFTDIINPGTYRIRSRRLTVSLRPPAELPGPFVFLVSKDGQTLVETESGTEWVRAPGEPRVCS